jgi:uncharacterized protein (DUF952 family)
MATPDQSRPTVAFKILTASQWQGWQRAPGQRFTGAGIDIGDGFIHLSTAAQAGTTYTLFFAPASRPEGCGEGERLDRNGEPLVVVEVDLTKVKDKVQWDVSRGGEAFPHVYGAIDMDAVGRTWEGNVVDDDLFRRLKVEMEK